MNIQTARQRDTETVSKFADFFSCGTCSQFANFFCSSYNTTGVGGSTIGNDISGINSLLTDFGVGINLHNHVTLPLIRIRKGIDAYRHKMKLDNKVVRRALINKI